MSLSDKDSRQLYLFPCCVCSRPCRRIPVFEIPTYEETFWCLEYETQLLCKRDTYRPRYGTFVIAKYNDRITLHPTEYYDHKYVKL